ncbi:Thiol-disulfide isomerase or thioredoxin [Nannocystis exedens]|uniref:Thiol-disulfide isomerase or thioredoxin n=1 Tax=Nannocystis exedens TaxID=54 RepID=A0A1I1XSB0_9BACT|nr:TlpA disulfide reductase family protein [Nannocystis exedens]PCC73235.1 Thiol-disulfide oxidoreductase ResA [Nannocystis exedens]SFE10131.1 Thiol-disulfide isomerase or thioredoxin [Nannocystis exedens]
MDRVRRGYHGRDWWGCAREGATLRLQYPDSAPLQAWTILCVARSGEDAVPLADAMMSERPGDPWALFARAGALIDHPGRGEAESIPAARVAQAALPDHPDATWQLARALVVHGAHSEAAAFFAAPPGPASAQLHALELAHTLNTPDVDAQRVFALAEQARAADPRCVDAEFLPGLWLLNRRRPAEAEVMVRRALELSPHSAAMRSTLWSAIRQAEHRDAADKRAAIEADMRLLLLTRGDAPEALMAARQVSQDLFKETYEALSAELEARFPAHQQVDWVRFERLAALWQARHERRQKGSPDPAADEQLRRELDAFIARPPSRPALLGNVYQERYLLVRDDEAAAPEALLAAVQAWAPHEQVNIHSLADAAVELAERTPYRIEAEAIARLALQRLDTRVAQARAAFADQAVVDSEAAYLSAALHSALGAVLLAQGRRAEARVELDQAWSQGKKGSPELFVRMAALAEAEGRIADAETLLVEGLSRWRGEEICEKPLKRLYQRQHGDDSGYAAYRQRLEAAVRDHRRAAILTTAIAEPKPLSPFVLSRLGGGSVRSESLRGRIAVINLWAKWCGPCVAEMPALQDLADAFASAPDVVVTTVNVDTKTDDLTAWLADRGLRLEVLLGTRYASDNGYNTLPLTLFVDHDGRIIFTHEGATERLVEEFTWRIEALRQRASAPASRLVRAAG